MLLKILAGITIGFLIGVGCQRFKLPLPAPPELIGSLLVLSMTLGFLLTDKLVGN